MSIKECSFLLFDYQNMVASPAKLSTVVTRAAFAAAKPAAWNSSSLFLKNTNTTIYNNLPNEFKSAPSLIAFKSGRWALVFFFKYLKGSVSRL